MKVRLQLIYDQSLSKVNASVTQVLIKAEGYKEISIPATEIKDELWQKIPLSPSVFNIEIEEEEFFDYANYQPKYRLQDVKGLGEIIAELSETLPYINSTTLSNGFLRCWNGDRRIEYVYYSFGEALTTIEEIKQEFIANCLGVPQHELFAFKTARQLGMELVFTPDPHARWIDRDCFCKS